MASITRTDFLNAAADARLEVAIAGIMSDYRSGWVAGSKGVTDVGAQLELRREVTDFALKRLHRMRQRKTYGYTA
jgi:hypothetical protein